jgi:hypothetical protein
MGSTFALKRVYNALRIFKLKKNGIRRTAMNTAMLWGI